MTTPLLHVRVGRIVSPLSDTHPLVAALYIGDDCVSDLVNHRDMRHVRAYYNGVLAGMTMTGAVRYGSTVVFARRGAYPFRDVEGVVPVNLVYKLADGIDPMLD